jgi:hypothetical protein
LIPANDKGLWMGNLVILYPVSFCLRSVGP